MRKEGAIATNLEIHYFLEGRSHAMDAYVRNKCEAELLEMAKVVADILNIDFDIETQAFTEGGLKELWAFLGKYNNQLTLIVCVLTLIYSRFPPADTELTTLKKTQMKLEIQKLEKELGVSEDQKISNDEKKIFQIINDSRVIKRKSNYYSKLLQYSKVSSLSLAQLDSNREPVDEPIHVHRQTFHEFVLTTDELDPEIDQNATIEIIAPVLKNARYKWKGVYNGEVISFRMKDSGFRRQVTSGDIPVHNGSCIDCVLRMSRELNDAGEVTIKNYEVLEVDNVHDEAVASDPSKKTYYQRRKKEAPGQAELF